MKKLLFALLVSASILSNVDARWGRRGGCAPCNKPVGMYECGEPPCCEKQELITVRAQPELICGYRCPTGFEEIE